MRQGCNDLTEREMEILHLIIFEYTTSEIAEHLFLSIDTIKSHRRNIFRKLSARNVAGLVRKAFEYDLIRFHTL